MCVFIGIIFWILLWILFIIGNDPFPSAQPRERALLELFLSQLTPVNQDHIWWGFSTLFKQILLNKLDFLYKFLLEICLHNAVESIYVYLISSSFSPLAVLAVIVFLWWVILITMVWDFEDEQNEFYYLEKISLTRRISWRLNYHQTWNMRINLLINVLTISTIYTLWIAPFIRCPWSR